MLGQFQHEVDVVLILEEAIQLQDCWVAETTMDVCLLLHPIGHPVDFHQMLVDLYRKFFCIS